MTDRRAFTLQPLVEAGIFEPGPAVLSCSVGGAEYFAGELPAQLLGGSVRDLHVLSRRQRWGLRGETHQPGGRSWHDNEWASNRSPSSQRQRVSPGRQYPGCGSLQHMRGGGLPFGEGTGSTLVCPGCSVPVP